MDRKGETVEVCCEKVYVMICISAHDEHSLILVHANNFSAKEKYGVTKPQED